MADNNVKMIEVCPGVRLRLRGASETWKAIESDFYIPATCIGCDTVIFCIQDAMYVLCPICRVCHESTWRRQAEAKEVEAVEAEVAVAELA